MYFVYILKRCDAKLYTGFTTNIKGRLANHICGNVLSTKNYRPLKLIHLESYILRTDAIRREKYLKTTEGKRILKQQIRDLLLKEKII